MLRFPTQPGSIPAVTDPQPPSRERAQEARTLDAIFVARKLRERWLADLTQYLDDYMRSCAFLECLRSVMTTSIQFQLLWKHRPAAHATGGRGHGPQGEPSQ